jgi:hypothetical protein
VGFEITKRSNREVIEKVIYYQAVDFKGVYKSGELHL